MRGKNWYYEINEYCRNVAFVYNVPLIKVAGIMSALSPNNTVKSNCISLEKFLRYKGDCKVTCFNGQKQKALNILKAPNNITEEQIMSFLGKGLKTKAFFHNIYTPKTSKMVTVDRWQIRWAEQNKIIPKGVTLTTKRYGIISDAVTKKAKEFNMLPHQYQSITWSAIRGKEY